MQMTEKYEAYVGVGDQTIESTSEGASLVDLTGKDFKDAIINMYKIMFKEKETSDDNVLSNTDGQLKDKLLIKKQIKILGFTS